jgi:DMSO reductase family type II enzyme heme b subunit
MGEGGNPVYLLRWTSDGGVEESTAEGLGAVAPAKQEEARAKGRAEYKDGRYRLVMKRPRLAASQAVAPRFSEGTFVPIAFFAWDGSHGEEGSKFAMSSWYYLRMEPPPSKGRWIYPPLVILAAFGLEIFGLQRFRRRAQR